MVSEELSSLLPSASLLVGPVQLDMLEQAVSAYETALMFDAAVSGRLAARGIDGARAVGFRLGVVAEPAGPGHDRVQGWLAIPYLDRSGKPLSVRFRRPFDSVEGPKYLGQPGERSRVFNVKAIHEARDMIHIAEGELDAIVLSRAGLPAVALPGATSWKPHHRRMLAGFDKVFVWADGDEAGDEMAMKVTQSFSRARPVRLPRGMDVTDVYVSEGTDGLLGALEAAGGTWPGARLAVAR